MEAEIISQTKGKKTISFVKRRRKHSSKTKKGHRQNITLLKVVDIKASEKNIKQDNHFEIIGKSQTTDITKKSLPEKKPVKKLATKSSSQPEAQPSEKVKSKPGRIKSSTKNSSQSKTVAAKGKSKDNITAKKGAQLLSGEDKNLKKRSTTEKKLTK